MPENEEGLGERLEWIVTMSHNLGTVLSHLGEAGKWWIRAHRDKTVQDETWCAIRELDGQRHALREGLRGVRQGFDVLWEQQSEFIAARDAAIRERDEAREDCACAQDQRNDMAREVVAARDAIRGQPGAVGGLVMAVRGFRDEMLNRLRRAEHDLAAVAVHVKAEIGDGWQGGCVSGVAEMREHCEHLRAENDRLRDRLAELDATAGWHDAPADDAPEVESFNAWRSRTGGDLSSCSHMFPDEKCGLSEFTRTCREVYEAEVVGKSSVP